MPSGLAAPKPLPLSSAIILAEGIATELSPYCERVAIAGSIRRRRPFVNDIDLVVLPKPHQTAALKDRCKRHARPVIDGPWNCIYALKSGFQLDIFIAEAQRKDLFQTLPTNFGTLLLCRTGSKEHNIYLVERAKSLGLRWNPHHGVFASTPGAQHTRLLPSETEEEIFTALQLDFIPPEKRER